MEKELIEKITELLQQKDGSVLTLIYEILKRI